IGVGLNTNKFIILATDDLNEFCQYNWNENAFGGMGASYLGYGSDPDLQNLLNTLGNGTIFTNTDACVLEFDMVPVADTVHFRYVFANTTSYTTPCSNLNN